MMTIVMMVMTWFYSQCICICIYIRFQLEIYCMFGFSPHTLSPLRVLPPVIDSSDRVSIISLLTPFTHSSPFTHPPVSFWKE